MTKITLEFHFVTTHRTQLNTMLENDESFSTKSLDNAETMNPIPVLSFKRNNEMKNNIEKCVQQQQQTIV
jgi:hypothetical protein